MPFVWQTKFLKVSIQSIINIINLSIFGLGSGSIKTDLTRVTGLQNCPGSAQI